MRRLFLLIMLAWASQPAWGENLQWFNDFGAAKEKAKAENKFVLLNFTGSDWCRWCKYLKGEVFVKPEFAAFAQEKLVLVEVDFPHQKMMAHLQKLANEQIAKLYHVGSYPTIVILSPDGQEMGRFGYIYGGPLRFIQNVEWHTRLNHVAPQLPPPKQTEPPPTSVPFNPPHQSEPAQKPVPFSLPSPAVPIQYGPLALKGISGSRERRMVLINNATMMTGETAKVRAEDRSVVICCKKICEDSVIITCDGKEMELKLSAK